MAIAITTLGKFEYIKGTHRAAYRLGIGGEGGGGRGPKKPQVTIGQIAEETEEEQEFEIYGIEEEVI
jgi:hypothetical protein